MSKLADAIRRTQRIESTPMGFGSARPAQRPTMLVGLLSRDAGEIGKAKDAGADLVLLDYHGKDVSAADLKGGVSEVLCGVDGKFGDAGGLHDAGVDFLAFEADDTAAASLLDESLGYVLHLPDEADDTYLRALDSISLDAVIVDAPKLPLTVEKQIALSRIAALSRQPLIVAVDAAIAKDDLQCLRAAGVAIVLADTAGKVKQLKETVASLPPRRTNREDQRTVVSLPRGSAAPGHDDDDDE